jgi:hypothetical protein
MSLNRSEINPLGVLRVRKLAFSPEHFTTVLVDQYIDTKLLDHWIVYNLNSRYAIKKKMTLDHNKKMVGMLEIGIEDPREITMLMLGCPYLHKKEKEIF